VKVATTTTKFLANKLRQENKEVFIVQNKLSKKDIDGAKKALLSLRGGGTTTKQSREDIVKLGYFSGTISHNKDFATITEPLMTIMEKYKNVELLLVGPLDVENDLVKKFGDRIKQLPYVKRSKHFANIAQCDINLAPLEYNNPFCEAKSELKFFEAGIVKVPTIAIDNQTYQDAIEDGVDGFTAKNSEEWTDKLAQLIENKDLRIKMGQKAYQKTIKEYTTQNTKNAEYYEYLKSKLK
jgi:glycosyltransferase involved in cell wall biosynthesis